MRIGPFGLRTTIAGVAALLLITVAAFFLVFPDLAPAPLPAAAVLLQLLALLELIQGRRQPAFLLSFVSACAAGAGVLGYLLAYNGLYVAPAHLGFWLIEFVHLHMAASLVLLLCASAIMVAAKRARLGFGAESLAAGGVAALLVLPLLFAGQQLDPLPRDVLAHPLLVSEAMLLAGLGIAQLLVARAWRADIDVRHRLLPVFVFVALVLASVQLWLVLVGAEQASIHRQAEATADRLHSSLRDHVAVRMDALHRLAQRMLMTGFSELELWRRDARHYLDDFESLSAIGWVTPDGRIRWAVNRDQRNYREGQVYAVDEARRIALETAQATGKATFSLPLPLRSGGYGQIIAIPLNDEAFHGWVVVGLRFDELFAMRIGDVAPDFAVTVATGGNLIYSRIADVEPHPLAVRVAHRIAFEELDWQISIWPEHSYFVRAFLWLPGLLLMLGVLAALLFAFSLHQLEAQRRHTAILRRSEERYRIVAEQTGAVVYDYHVPSGRIEWAGAIAEVIGDTPAAFEKVDVQEWERRLHPDDAPLVLRELERAQRDIGRFLCEYRFRRADGSYVRVVDRGVFLGGANGEAERMLGKMADVTQRHDFEQQLRHLAHYDQQTGLHNRVHFMHDAVRHANAGRDNGPLWFVFLDLDRFRAVNETLGHDVGDALLESVARRLEAVGGQHSALARIGGDEFGFCVHARDMDRDAMRAFCERLLEAFGRPFEVAGHSLFVTLSIGVANYPGDGRDAESAMRAAETAMFRAKQRGRNTFAFYEAAMSAGARENLEIANALRRALERNEFHLVYQPRFDLASGRITGMEALLRWESADLGPVPPAQFIPVAEETGLIGPIGWYVVEAAAAAARRLGAELMLGRRIAINVSARQLVHGDFVTELVRRVEAAGAQPQWFEVELTESLVMEDPQRARALFVRLHDAGFLISIDDFGTGYSSLSYLKHFPVDHLKIDRSFVMGLPQNADDAAIVRTVVGIGQGLGLKLIAEGIETDAQAEHLRRAGCQEGQGFLFARPMSLAQLSVLLD